MGSKVEIRFEAVLPPKNYPQAQLLLAVEAMKNTLRGKVARLLRQEMNKTVQGWQHKPEFRDKLTGTRDITLIVYPAGRYGKRWVWIDRGTQARDIVPKSKPVLAFQPEYTPKTTKSGGRGGSGTYSGDYVRTRRVKRHKIEPREFREKIVEDVRDDVVDMLTAALGGALK